MVTVAAPEQLMCPARASATWWPDRAPRAGRGRSGGETPAAGRSPRRQDPRRGSREPEPDRNIATAAPRYSGEAHVNRSADDRAVGLFYLTNLTQPVSRPPSAPTAGPKRWRCTATAAMRAGTVRTSRNNSGGYATSSSSRAQGPGATARPHRRQANRRVNRRRIRDLRLRPPPTGDARTETTIRAVRSPGKDGGHDRDSA